MSLDGFNDSTRDPRRTETAARRQGRDRRRHRRTDRVRGGQRHLGYAIGGIRRHRRRRAGGVGPVDPSQLAQLRRDRALRHRGRHLPRPPLRRSPDLLPARHPLGHRNHGDRRRLDRSPAPDGGVHELGRPPVAARVVLAPSGQTRLRASHVAVGRVLRDPHRHPGMAVRDGADHGARIRACRHRMARTDRTPHRHLRRRPQQARRARRPFGRAVRTERSS